MLIEILENINFVDGYIFRGMPNDKKVNRNH